MPIFDLAKQYAQKITSPNERKVFERQQNDRIKGLMEDTYSILGHAVAELEKGIRPGDLPEEIVEKQKALKEQMAAEDDTLRRVHGITLPSPKWVDPEVTNADIGTHAKFNAGIKLFDLARRQAGLGKDEYSPEPTLPVLEGWQKQLGEGWIKRGMLHKSLHKRFGSEDEATKIQAVAEIIFNGADPRTKPNKRDSEIDAMGLPDEQAFFLKALSAKGHESIRRNGAELTIDLKGPIKSIVEREFNTGRGR